jgi:hypothetical protein
VATGLFFVGSEFEFLFQPFGVLVYAAHFGGYVYALGAVWFARVALGAVVCLPQGWYGAVVSDQECAACFFVVGVG